MPRLIEAARARNLLVIEDACQATGGTLSGRPLGAWGDLAVVSFGGSKLLSAGRGGAVLSYKPELAQRIKLYQQRGNEAYPLSELQAAVLGPQLTRLDEQHRQRADWVAALRTRLPEEHGLHILASPYAEASTAYYKVGFWYDPACFQGVSRDQFAAAMRAEGFAMFPGFRALHQCHARGRFRAPAPLTQSERAEASLLVLHHPHLLEGLETVDQFLAAVKKLRDHAAALRDAPALANLDSRHDN
jgi:dTDP-4-amino-4,6-dideoxygalactose transaminase